MRRLDTRSSRRGASLKRTRAPRQSTSASSRRCCTRGQTIGDAGGLLRAYDGRDKSLLDVAEDVKETADSVYLSMVQKRRAALSGS